VGKLLADVGLKDPRQYGFDLVCGHARRWANWFPTSEASTHQKRVTARSHRTRPLRDSEESGPRQATSGAPE